MSRKAQKKKRPRGNLIAKGRKRRVFPTNLERTPEAWRDFKRQEWREVMAALERFRYGSAYTPEQDAQYRLWKLSIQIDEAVNAKGWIAW
jgi:hypothetical protein